MFRVFFPLLLFISISFAGQLEEFLEKVKKHAGLEGSFVQISQIEGFEKQTYEGKFTLLKNGTIKLIYEKPEFYEILIQKNISTTYYPSENQVIISRIDNNLILIGIFKILSGQIPVEKYFSVEEKNGVYILRPKNSKTFKELKQIKLSFKKENLIQVFIEDKEGNITILNISIKKYLDKLKKLDINYPENAEIIRY